ncbi:MAG: UDP-3-O-(3-hydroxymyristoyl)glucosamine N-acyltransferase [Armatimonadetes bacterium]|nr:UDP-3-O-(3-hydroxymyristoyl)glucosamine N-acyltransferase [Armatimonadota bacterium]
MNLAELARRLDAELVGPAELPVTGVGAPEEARPGQVVAAFDDAALVSAEAGPAAALVVGAEMSAAKPHLRVADPRAAFEQLLDLFAPPPPPPAGIHPRALVDPSAVIGAEPTLGPHAVIGPRVVLGDRCRIGANCVVGEAARLGNDVTLHANVTLYAGVELGDRVIVHSGAVLGADGFGYRSTAVGHVRVPHLGTVVLEDDVEVGANATIDRAKVGATRVGQGCKIDNLVLIAHNCRLGRHCLMVGQSALAGSVELGEGVVMAGQSGIADHLRVGDGAVVAGQAGVMKPLSPGARVAGSPALDQVEYFKQLAGLRRLRQLARRVEALERALGRTADDDAT